MTKQTRALAAASLFILPAAAFGQTDPLQDWLAGNAVEVRSLDAADEDFSDLEPLIRAIGNARVVQLGEVSHGAGSHFAAKVRLIKFLHQRMGFDVLLWESGMYSLTQTQAGLLAGDDPVQAGRRGIFPLWSMMEQVKPVFEYAQATRSTPLPLEMAGFDVQFSSPDSAEKFAAELRGFIATLPDSDVRRDISSATEQTLTGFKGFSLWYAEQQKQYAAQSRLGAPLEQANVAVQKWAETEGLRFENKPEDLKSFLDAAGKLIGQVKTHREALLQVHGARRLDFMTHAIENLREHGSSVFETYAAGRPMGDAARPQRNLAWNRRDTQNARTLRWMIEDYYKDRKIILWAHNGHVMNAFYAADWGSLSDKPQPQGMKPSGAFLTEWFGNTVYSIGMTGYEGKDKHMFRDETLTVAPATAGSLEHRLHQLGKPYLFVDFRAIDGASGHPLHRPQAMRVRGTGEPETLPDLTKVYDAVFYVDQLTPATRIKPPQPPAPAPTKPPATP